MTQIGQWSTVDKTDWGPGPWQDEPDKVHWIDEATDFDCLMVRRDSLGHWCGYVGLPPGHRLYDKSYDDPDVEVHGGLTFGSMCRESEDPSKGVCHVAQPGRPEHLFWLGFDCAHAGDVSPGMRQYLETVYYLSDAYRDASYVKAEVESLARQLA